MKKRIVLICLLFTTIHAFNQTLNWNTAIRIGPAPNYTYTGTGISAAVSFNAVTFGDGTPRVDGVSGISACYLNPGLALYAGFFNSYLSSANSHITTTFSFLGGYGCSDVTLIIKDINSDESSTTFCDVLEISGTYDNSNIALPAANIITTLASNVTRSVSGSTVKLIGHNSVSETTVTATSGVSCGSTTVKFSAPAGLPLKTFTIKYRPAYGSSISNAYYNVSPKPGAQYISIGNLSFVATSGCFNLTFLPIELVSFDAIRKNNVVNLNWQTASEKNNDYFTIERSLDGINFEEIKKVKGAGNSLEVRNYISSDENPSSELSYYRLKQTDYDGEFKYSNIVSVEADNSKASLSHVAPNPTNSSIGFDFYTPTKGDLVYQITDLTGRVLITESKVMDAGNSKVITSLDELPEGIYFLKVIFDKTNLVSVNKIFKN